MITFEQAGDLLQLQINGPCKYIPQADVRFVRKTPDRFLLCYDLRYTNNFAIEYCVVEDLIKTNQLGEYLAGAQRHIASDIILDMQTMANDIEGRLNADQA